MLAASLVTVALGRDLVLHQLQKNITTTSGPPPGSVSVFKKSNATALLHHVDCWVDGSALPLLPYSTVLSLDTGLLH